MGGSNARVGHSDFLVVESDESDGSFLKLAPIIAVVTNIDREHLDHYPSLDDIRAGVHRVRQQGAVLRRRHCVPGRRERAADSARHQPAHHHLWTEHAGRLQPRRRSAATSRAIFSWRYTDAIWAVSICAFPATHNVLNATAAVAVALELEVPPETIREALASFHRRRPAISDARRGARHHRDRRLRSSSHRDPRHAGCRAALRISAASMAVSSRTATRARCI